jgi:hypothetical protein
MNRFIRKCGWFTWFKIKEMMWLLFATLCCAVVVLVGSAVFYGIGWLLCLFTDTIYSHEDIFRIGFSLTLLFGIVCWGVYGILFPARRWFVDFLKDNWKQAERKVRDNETG